MKRSMDEYVAELVRYYFRIARRSNRIIAPSEVSLSRQQWLLLATLFEMGKCKVSELAEKIGLSSGATTTAVNRLVKNEYIIRTRDEADRRVVWIELTDQAKQAIKQMWGERRKEVSLMLAPLDEQEIETLVFLLRKISTHYDV